MFGALLFIQQISSAPQDFKKNVLHTWISYKTGNTVVFPMQKFVTALKIVIEPDVLRT